jgi:hypothetical protein
MFCNEHLYKRLTFVSVVHGKAALEFVMQNLMYIECEFNTYYY